MMKNNISFSPLLSELVEELTIFPGVGHKTAQRMAFFLLKEQNRRQCTTLGELLIKTAEIIRHCSLCNNLTENPICDICQHPKRNPDQLCVVESPADVIALEQSACFNGHYFVLMGALSPLDGIGPEELKINKLMMRLRQSTFHEIILATNATVEGEATADYIASLAKALRIKASRIAYGIPIGGELEYIDGNTLEKSFKQRMTIEA